MPLLPEAGISLLDCLKCIPAMSGHLERLDLHSNTYRGVAKKNERTDFTTLSFVVHPGAPMPERVFEQVTWPATQMEQLQWIEFPGGGAVNITIPKGHDHPHWTGQQPQLPAGATMSVDDTRFWYRSEPLNEFGFLYTALFIAGNYARYYPDRWIVDVEHSAPLALAIEELLHIADERIPWLISSELERRYYVRGELTA
jgi:hypothetical protein